MKRSKLLLVAAILGTAYAVYLFTYFGNSLSSGGSDTETIGAGIATMMVLPHFVMVLVAAIFNWLGFAFRFRWAALVAGICYAVAMALFIVYFMFVIVEMILSFIAYAKMKKATV